MELNREQIVKALECCNSEHSCSECPYCGDCYYGKVCDSALALIRELTEENEMLRESGVDYRNIPYIKSDVRADTVRKMQIKFQMYFGTYTADATIKVSDVFRLLDKFTEEMLEEEWNER